MLEAMVGDRQLVKPRHGHYGLAPALIQRLKADYLLGSNSKQTQSETEVSQVPDEVPMGKAPGNQQTYCAAEHRQKLLPMRHEPWDFREDDPHRGLPTSGEEAGR